VIDTHAHLDAGAAPADELLRRAREAGVDRVIAIGTGLDSCRAVLRLAEANDGVHAALGIDPHRAATAETTRVGELAELLDHPKVVAVGETGLDYHYGAGAKPEQRRLFEAQLQLASDRGLPVVIHSRAAADDTAAALAGFAGTVVLHCFSEPALEPAAADRGYFASFAGNVTYPSARDLRAVAARLRRDRLLVETDTPYLSPQPRRGKPNEPANIVHTVAALAEARGEDETALAAQLDANAAAAFSLT
jgi:TatD DNase family protein